MTYSRNYKRICQKCHEEKIVHYKPKGHELCIKCSRKRLGPELAKKRYKNYKHVRYIYFCPTCSNVSESRVRHKTAYCGKCNHKYSKKKPIKGYFDMDTLKYVIPKPRYFRICQKCGDVKEVKSKQSAQNKLCSSCCKIKAVKKPSMPKAEIERQRELNRQHREEMAKVKRVKLSSSSDAEMIADFLKDNKPSVIDTIIEIPYMPLSGGLGFNSSEVGI